MTYYFMSSYVFCIVERYYQIPEIPLPLFKDLSKSREHSCSGEDPSEDATKLFSTKQEKKIFLIYTIKSHFAWIKYLQLNI